MIYLIGGSGGPNYGDELLMALWVRCYREMGYQGPIIVDCRGRQSSERLHGQFENVYFTSFIKQLATGRAGSFAEHVARGRAFIDEHPSEQTQKLAELEVCGIGWSWNQIRHVHLFGGGYINGKWPNSASLLGAAAQLRQQYGIPCLATGLGIAPLSGLGKADAEALVEAIRSFSLFELRDLQSYNDVAALVGFRATIVCGLDDCFLYSVEGLTRPRRIPGRALHLSGFEASFASVSDEALVQFLKTYQEEFPRVFFWQCNRSDVEVGERLKRLWPEMVKLTNASLLTNGAPVADGDFMVTGRFHPHLIAARAGATGYFIANSTFYSVKHSSVVDLGSPFEAMSDLRIAGVPPHRNVLKLRDNALCQRKRLLAQVLAESALHNHT
ncbi:MAG TPA: polysaccharide pyruvyl transferase family protein [Polyangiaceae bacterium]|nr:polysaccharide pyruvyl transferase family protein [Polyangiaceae bacterium]